MLKNTPSILFQLATTALTSLGFLAPTLSQAVAIESPGNQTTFICISKFDTALGKAIPVTAAWVPERKTHVHFISWRSEHFIASGWTMEKRCQEVSKKFQQLHSQNRLNHLSYGRNNGYPIICGVANIEEPCNGDNQLFTLRTDADAKGVILQLMHISQGKASEELIQSNKNNQNYVNVRVFLNQSPNIAVK